MAPLASEFREDVLVEEVEVALQAVDDLVERKEEALQAGFTRLML